MKRFLFAFALVGCGLFASCSDENKPAGDPGLQDSLAQDTSAENSPSAALPWLPADTLYEGGGVKGSGYGEKPESVQAVIRGLNEIWPEVPLQEVRRSGDTLFVRIPDSEVLTNQSGTTGALNYLATATYNLTEIPGIRAVSFDFEEGEHLSPGTFSRQHFAVQH